ncbi:MAG TPA: VOC family protein [Blastocatellia bacterium]|nr:VOC family protein [Blastocatellia bacterium]
MGIGIVGISHIQITVPASAEEPSKRFYRDVLGMEEVPKPGDSKGRGGAWFRHGSVELHLSVEDGAIENHSSRRHICYLVADLAEAAFRLRGAGIEIIPDDRPIDGWQRFYVRDPGANRIEIAQQLESVR